MLIIGEHGNYPRNEKGQVLYPRYEFFEQCVKVFEQDGRAVPVYNDKHLSYSFEKAKAMVDASRRLRFPMLAGSSIPVTWRLPAIDLPLGCQIEEALMVGVGGSDPMDFHALEGLQCMVERRQRRRDRRESRAVARRRRRLEGRRGRPLLEGTADRGALAQRHAARAHGSTTAARRTWWHRASCAKLAKKPAAYFIEYRDGLKATMLMLDGAVKDFNFAARLNGVPQLQSTQFLLTPEPNVTYSACLMHKVEEMFESGAAPYPVERTLLVSGMLESCLTSKVQDHARLETPHLSVAYKAPQQSQFAQA